MRKQYFAVVLLVLGLGVFASCDKESQAEKHVGNAVDLGLSVKWADCNVGATRPEESGEYVAWGETETKQLFQWSTYPANSDAEGIEFSKYNETDRKAVLDAQDDLAHVKWNGAWRMPTANEIQELCDTGKCTWTWTSRNGVQGYEVKSRLNGNAIFLPAVGYKFGRNFFDEEYGCYWSGSLDTLDVSGVHCLLFHKDDFMESTSRRYIGRPVRPVCP